MPLIINWQLVTRLGAGSLALSLVIPMMLPSYSIFRLYCYVAAAISIAICIFGASRLDDEKAAKAASDGAILSDPHSLPDGGFGGDGGGLGDASD
jgi:hypothetical protein